jgi:hypothetical protein
MQLKRLSLVLLFSLAVMPAHANSVCENKRLDVGEGAAKNVRASAPFKIPASVLRRGEHEACSIVEFYVNEDGLAYKPKVVFSFPRAGVGRAALEALKGYHFKHKEDRRSVLFFYYNRFAITQGG